MKSTNYEFPMLVYSGSHFCRIVWSWGLLHMLTAAQVAKNCPDFRENRWVDYAYGDKAILRLYTVAEKFLYILIFRFLSLT
jgi:hypothetical protein